MNFVTLCAQTTEAPREVYISANSTATRCLVLLPPVGNKAPTSIDNTPVVNSFYRQISSIKNFVRIINGIPPEDNLILH